MNKTFQQCVVAAILILAASACSNSVEGNGNGGNTGGGDGGDVVITKQYMKFGATTPASTRATYNSVLTDESDPTYDVVKIVTGITIDWAQGDKLGLYSDALTDESSNKPANMMLTAPANPESEGNIIHTESGNNFYAFVPASKITWNGTAGTNNMFYAYRQYNAAQNTSATTITHVLPATQDVQVNNFQYLNDKGYDFAYAKTILTANPSDNVIPLNFVHPYAILLIRFCNLTNGTNLRTVTGVTVTTDGNGYLAGTNTFDLTSSTIDTRNISGNESAIISPTVTDGSKTITISSIAAAASRAPIIDDGTNTPAGLETEAGYVVIALNPAGAQSGNKLTITFTGKQTVGDATYSKTVSTTLTSNLIGGTVYRLRISAN